MVWRLYRRLRRDVGRQAFFPGRLNTRIVFFALVTVLIALPALGHPRILLGLAGGLLASVPLVWIGLRLTRFERVADRVYYTPNAHIGIALSLLFVGRILYRFALIYGFAVSDGRPQPAAWSSPLTLFLFGLPAGYYIAFSAAVLVRGRALASASPPQAGSVGEAGRSADHSTDA